MFKVTEYAALNKIEHWATNNGFKIFKVQTQCVHFCQLPKQHNDPVLTLYGSPIPVVQEYKYLGLIFDKKLSLIPEGKMPESFEYIESFVSH